MKCLVIHLERAQDRRAHVDRIVKAVPLPAEVLPACDGAALEAEERAGIYPGKELYEPRYPFELSSGEIGCFQSHRRAWQKILDDGLEAALIVEDDVEILDGFDRAFEFAVGQPARFGYIQFQVRPVSGEVVAKENGSLRLLRPGIVPLRTSAQLVSRAAAEQLLSVTEQIDRPVDTFLQMVWETGVPVHCIDPSCVRDRTVEAGGSTVSRKRSYTQKLAAELKRGQYRRAIARLSAKL